LSFTNFEYNRKEMKILVDFNVLIIGNYKHITTGIRH
jgi:hypothetical protein